MNRIFYTLKKIIIFFSPLTKLLIKIYKNKIFIAIKYSLILFKSIIQFSDTKITILKRPKLSKHVSRSPSFDSILIFQYVFRVLFMIHSL